MGEPDVADAYRIGGSTLGAAVFDRAGGVGPLRPAQRSPAQDVHRLRPADAGLPAPAGGRPHRERLRGGGDGGADRDLVVVADGGYAKREFLRHCQSMSKPIVVVTKLRKDASLYQPAPPRRPGQIGRPRVVGARLPSPTAVLDDPATQWIPYRATGSDGSTAMVELASGVALWYHGGPPRLPIRWVVIRYLAERRGPYALLCTDTEAEPLRILQRILQWYLLRWQVEVTFEELRAHLGMESQRQWSERAIARTTPALFGLFSVVTLAADILIGQQGGMAPRTPAWYDKTSPSFADAIALVRRHLWVQQGTFMPSEREHESIKVPRLLYHRMLDTLAYAA